MTDMARQWIHYILEAIWQTSTYGLIWNCWFELRITFGWGLTTWRRFALSEHCLVVVVVVAMSAWRVDNARLWVCFAMLQRVILHSQTFHQHKVATTNRQQFQTTEAVSPLLLCANLHKRNNYQCDMWTSSLLSYLKAFNRVERKNVYGLQAVVITR